MTLIVLGAAWFILLIIDVWQSYRLARQGQKLLEMTKIVAQGAVLIAKTSRQWQLAEHNLERACAELAQHGAAFERDAELPQERLS